MLLSGDVWTVASEMDVGKYDILINSLSDLMQNLSFGVNYVTRESSELYRIMDGITKLQGKLDSVQLLTKATGWPRAGNSGKTGKYA